MREPFGISPNGQSVERLYLQGSGLSAQILTWGGTLQSLHLEGVPYSLVLGLPDLPSYLQSKSYLGATVGRFANRIVHGQARIAGQDYQLSRNFLGKHLLHGGVGGADRQVWQVVAHEKSALTLQLILADGHMGFPGELSVQLTYRLVAPATLEIEFNAHTSKPTLCNFAHHSYFNLDGSDTIQTHQLQIAAAHYLPVDSECIPTGAITSVENTAFDFRTLRSINQFGSNYDHNFCLPHSRQLLREVAVLKGTQGVQMTLATTESGLQLYDGQYLDNGFQAYAGLALEPQGWPDSPHHAAFPSAELLPEQNYQQISRFSFKKLNT